MVQDTPPCRRISEVRRRKAPACRPRFLPDCWRSLISPKRLIRTRPRSRCLRFLLPDLFRQACTVGRTVTDGTGVLSALHSFLGSAEIIPSNPFHPVPERFTRKRKGTEYAASVGEISSWAIRFDPSFQIRNTPYPLLWIRFSHRRSPLEAGTGIKSASLISDLPR